MPGRDAVKTSDSPLRTASISAAEYARRIGEGDAGFIKNSGDLLGSIDPRRRQVDQQPDFTTRRCDNVFGNCKRSDTIGHTDKDSLAIAGNRINVRCNLCSRR